MRSEIKVIFAVVLLQKVARRDVAKTAAQNSQPALTAHIPEYGKMAWEKSVIQGDRSIQEDVVTSANDQQAVVRRQGVHRRGVVDGLTFQPALHEVFREKPFPGDLGGRQALVVNEGVNHLFIDLQKVCDFPGGEKSVAGMGFHAETLVVMVSVSGNAAKRQKRIQQKQLTILQLSE